LVLGTGIFGAVQNASASPSGAASSQAPSSPQATNQFPAYFIEWGVYQTTHNYVPADIPADKLTHIHYAFIKPVPVENSNNLWTCGYYDPWAAVQKPDWPRLVPGTNQNANEHVGAINQLKVLRRNHPGLKLMMSLEGYVDPSIGSKFPMIASSAVTRTHFVNTCVDFMKNNGFDGIDVDWEYPGASDKANFTALLQEFRTRMNSTQGVGSGAPLSIAAGPTAAQAAGYDMPALNNILTYVNIMAYDFYGGFSDHTGHNAPLCAAAGDPKGASWNGNAAVQMYINGGVAPGKLNYGLAFYGRAMQHLQNTGPNASYPGRFAPITPGDYVRGTWDPSGGPQSVWTGAMDYWDIMDRFTGPFVSSTTPLQGLNGYTRYWDNQQIAAFDHRPDAVGPNGSGLWISYDDPQSLTTKVNYARTLGLGGVFVWELSQESHPGMAEHPLSTAIYSALTAVSAPSFQCSAAEATATSTSTATRTSTPTRTATSTSTSTVAPTQTPGGPTATTVPATATSTVAPSQTPGGPAATATATAIATQTPGGTGECDVQFTDVGPASPFYTFVRCLACKNILGGYPDGTFRTNNNVTRGQLSKIIANAAGYTEATSGQMFQDVDAQSPFYEFVQRLASRGHISGYVCGGAGEPCVGSNLPYFRPNANATRGQISKIVSNAAEFDNPVSGQTFEDVPPSSPFYQWIQRLTSRAIMSGYECGGAGEPCIGSSLPYFRPNSNATRGQTAKIVSNTFFPNCQVP
jgi:GH18 family chitinase